MGFVSDVVYPWVTGGVESVQHDEMSELSKKHDIYSFSLRFPGMRELFSKRRINYVGVAPAKPCEIYTKSGSRSIGLAGRFARHLPGYLRRYDLNLIYVNSFPYLHLGYIKKYCNHHKCKLVLDVAEVWTLNEWKAYLGSVKGYLAYLYMKKSLTGADVYVANSSSTAQRLNNIVGIPKHKIKIFAPVINIKELSKYRTRKKNNTILYAGRLIKEKSLLEWCDAVAAAHDINPSVNGLIIGEGPQKKDILLHIRKNRYGSFIKTAPFMEKKKLYRKISESAALLNMSEREGLSVISLESLALNTPVVLPDYTPIPKEVKSICSVMDISKIPELLANIVSSKSKSKFIKKKSSLNRFDVKRTNAFFESLLN